MCDSWTVDRFHCLGLCQNRIKTSVFYSQLIRCRDEIGQDLYLSSLRCTDSVLNSTLQQHQRNLSLLPSLIRGTNTCNTQARLYDMTMKLV